MLARYAPSSYKWRGSQVVRSRSAKPLFAGSIPAPASKLESFGLRRRAYRPHLRRDSSCHAGENTCGSPFGRLLFWRSGKWRFGRISKNIVSDNARIATKRRHRLDRKAWTQNAKTVPYKRKGNDYEHCCRFHVSGFYRMNRTMTREF
jgi:hypothetical protein